MKKCPGIRFGLYLHDAKIDLFLQHLVVKITFEIMTELFKPLPPQKCVGTNRAGEKCDNVLGPFRPGNVCHNCEKPSLFAKALQQWHEETAIKEIEELVKEYVECNVKCPVCRTQNKIPKNRQKVYSDTMCMICLEEKADVFLPECGHLCMCSGCMELHNKAENDRADEVSAMRDQYGLGEFEEPNDFIEELEREFEIDDEEEEFEEIDENGRLVLSFRTTNIDLDDLPDEYLHDLQEALDERFQQMLVEVRD